MSQPLMPKATAVWLVENTALSFAQIAEYTGMHELEISGIADGEVAVGIKGLDPITNGQLTAEEIARCEKNPRAKLIMARSKLPADAVRRKGPRYTPLSKRQDRPSAIAWLVRYHPELADAQITKLVGTTKSTIESVRERTHWNIANIRPTDPVALGLCKQMELDEAVLKASARRKAMMIDTVPAEPQDRLLDPTESLRQAAAANPATAQDLFRESSMTAPDDEEEHDVHSELDADSLFSLPAGGANLDDEDE